VGEFTFDLDALEAGNSLVIINDQSVHYHRPSQPAEPVVLPGEVR